MSDAPATPTTDAAEVPRSRRRKSPHVGGQLHGYSLQTTRAFVRLLEADSGSFVSVEVFEDVGVETPQGRRTAEQTKSARTKNPIADRSVDLWKTLANWVDAVDQGEITAVTTTFELFVSRKCRGALAEAFARAATPDASTAALASARDVLWGAAPARNKRARLARTLAQHVDRVLDANEALVVPVIQRFVLVFGTGDPMSEALRVLARKIVSPEMLDVVASQMLGWTKVSLDRLLATGKPAVLSADDFERELRSFVRKHDRGKILTSFAPAPSPETVAAELPVRTYIRQLDLIELDYDDKLRAANDYLRAALDRSIWAEKGLVHPSSFDEFTADLERTWRAKKLSVEARTPADAHVNRGRLLYAECSEVKRDLEALPVPAHFAPGCFHSLADALTVGWHPSYRALLDIAEAAAARAEP